MAYAFVLQATVQWDRSRANGLGSMRFASGGKRQELN
jgi:hypothetical protein